MYGFYENDNAFSDNNVDYPFCRYMGLNNRLNIITFIESKLNNIMTNLIFLGYYYDDSILLYFPSWNCFDNVLEEIKWMSEKNNFTFIVFTIPHHTSPNPVAITLKNQINGRVKKNNLLVIENFVDLFWEKTENITDYELRVNREEKPHFNEMGHKIIAGVLYEHLTKNILKNET